MNVETEGASKLAFKEKGTLRGIIHAIVRERKNIHGQKVFQTMQVHNQVGPLNFVQAW